MTITQQHLKNLLEDQKERIVAFSEYLEGDYNEIFEELLKYQEEALRELDVY